MYQNGETTGATFQPADWHVIAPPAPDPSSFKSTLIQIGRWAAPVISIAILVAVASTLRTFDLATLRALIPVSVAFWLIFALYYISSPLADWIIFRRLWKLPVGGFFALVRKLVGNELLLGYVGELYFYSWARQRARMVGAPFGAIKDVAILSAVAGNVMTLAMLVVAYPMLAALHLEHDRAVFFSIIVVLASSLVPMILRRRLFSLPGRELMFVTIVHFIRIIARTALAAWMWHIALPSVAIGLWLLLSTMRLLLSRLPFIPNKDVVFAGMAIFAVGQDHEVAALMTLMAGLILGTHLVVGALLAAGDLTGWLRKQ